VLYWFARTTKVSSDMIDSFHLMEFWSRRILPGIEAMQAGSLKFPEPVLDTVKIDN